ncbi:Cytoplasmic Dynein 2 Heavy Chain 1 [Manis pentadactyla]|nr:Cytoplasmic Dynein 2 Heavy Chain 1 [Manis pentadactyla]
MLQFETSWKARVTIRPVPEQSGGPANSKLSPETHCCFPAVPLKQTKPTDVSRAHTEESAFSSPAQPKIYSSHRLLLSSGESFQQVLHNDKAGSEAFSDLLNLLGSGLAGTKPGGGSEIGGISYTTLESLCLVILKAIITCVLGDLTALENQKK